MGKHFSRITKEDSTEVWKCNYCGFECEDKIDMAHHHDPRRKDKCTERKFGAKETEGGEKKGPLYKAKADQNDILKGILMKHPSITQEQMDEVMSWTDLKGPLHPFELTHLLSNMEKIPKTTANIIGQKYGVALNKAALEGEAEIQMFLSQAPRLSPTQPFGFGPMQPYQQPTSPQTYQPWQSQQWTQPQQQAITTEDVRKMIKEVTDEKVKEDKLDAMEKNVQSLTNAVHTLTETVQEGGGVSQEEDVIKITEPIRDDKGNIIVDANGNPITRTIAGPASKITSMEDPATKLLNQLTLFEKIRGKEMTTDDIKAAVKEMMPASTEDAKVKELTEKVEKLKEEMSTKERARLEDEIKELKADVKTVRGSLAAGEYKSDEMRLLGTSVSRLADIAEGRKPLETAAGVLIPPAEGGAEPRTKGALAKMLEGSGYVVEE